MKGLFLFCFLIYTFSCTGLTHNFNQYTYSAGSYFPSDKTHLKEIVLKHINSHVKDPTIEQNIYGIIAPHAGYEYSGTVAGIAYKQLYGLESKTAIIIANSHSHPINGIAIFAKGTFETPLGVVPIDEELSKHLLKKFPFIKFNFLAFDREHPIDNQIPFLQLSIKKLKIVPLLIGNITKDERDELADFLSDLISKEPDSYLIVASTDMSHYFNYNKAIAIDTNTIKKLNYLDVEGLEHCISRKDCELCGFDAVSIILHITKKIKGNIKFLKYLNSGDTIGDKNSVVGYSAYAFTYSKDNAPLNMVEKKVLLKIARKTLEKYVLKNEIPNIIPEEKKLLKKGAVFVTLKKNNMLRGCMGSLNAEKPLFEAVISATIQTAVRDMRFSPVTPEELKDIKIEISVLGDIKKIKNINEIEVGKHGVYLCKNLNCAVFLPQVAVENNWDRDELLKRLAIKAGLPPSDYKDKNTEIYIFTANIFSEESN